MKATKPNIKLLIIAMLASWSILFAPQLAAKAQDIAGVASRVTLKPSPSRTPVTRNVTRNVIRVPGTGAIVVAAEPNAQILVEPLRGNPGLEGRIPEGERIFIFKELKPGRYRISAELTDHKSSEKEVVVTAGKISTVTLDLPSAFYSVTINTNVSTGEVRYAPMEQYIDPNTKEIKYKSEGVTSLVQINDGRATLPKLRKGRYGVDIVPGEAGYRSALAVFEVTGKQETYNVNLEREVRTSSPIGRYYALMIGNNDYPFLPRLKTAENDAREISTILQERYGFETKLLLNANRQQILGAIYEYRRKLDPDASLLIYYAGHGINDFEVERSYWLPVDAIKANNANWVSADDITGNIKGIPARHVLVVSDSCYSGTITRGFDLSKEELAVRDKFLQKMISGKSRTLMASGGDEPVADGGGGGSHSVFANALLRGLDKMDKDMFTAAELFQDFIQQSVAGGASQTPEYNPLRNSGHDRGDFVFIRTKNRD